MADNIVSGNESENTIYTFSNLAPLGSSEPVVVESEEMDIWSGDYYESIIVSGGYVSIYSDATVNHLKFYSGGLALWDGGVIMDLEAPSDIQLSLEVTSDTYLAGTIGGSAVLIQNGIFSNFTADSTHNLDVGNGGVVSHVTINLYGYVGVSSGGMLSDVTVNSDGELYVYAPATVSGVTVNNGGDLYVFTGGSVSGITWTPFEGRIHAEVGAGISNSDSPLSGIYYGSKGKLVSRESEMNAALLGSSCEMYVMSGGSATAPTVAANGHLYVGSGGTATGILENGGYVFVEEGANVTFAANTLSGLTIKSSATVHSGTVANQTQVSGRLFIADGGFASGTRIFGDGQVIVCSGGEVIDTTVSSGYLRVTDGGTANSTIVSRGYFLISSGGSVNIATVSSGAGFNIFSGGTANGVTVSSGGSFNISSGGTATNIIANNSSYLSFDVASDTYVQGIVNDRAFEMKDAYISGFTLEKGNCFNVLSGAVADSIAVSGGYMAVSNGGVANGVTFGSRGSFYVFSGGTATNIIADSNSYLSFDVAPDTYVQGTVNGHAFEIKDANISGFSLEKGNLNVSSGGTADGTIVSSGYLYVSSGGIVDNTTVSQGVFYLTCGGTASNVTVSSGGSFYVFRGATLTGRMNFASGAYIYFVSGSILNFDITGVAPGAAALVNNLSYAGDSPNYTLTVDGTQENGDYILAEGASGFEGTITVVNLEGEELCTLELGTSVKAADSYYTLSKQENALVLTVGDEEFVPVTSSGVYLINETRTVNAGELYQDTFIESGGILNVAGGGRTRNTVIGTYIDLTAWEQQFGGWDYYGGGYYEYYEYDEQSDGKEIVSAGARADGTVLCCGSQMVYGTADNTVISGSDCYGMYQYIQQEGSQFVMSGGTAKDTQMQSGYQIVSSSGTAENTTIQYGCQYVMAGGVAVGNVISGGAHYVYAGGSVLQETLSGGVHYISGYGEDIDVIRGTVSMGGQGNVRDLHIHSGASMVVSGGSVTDLMLDSGAHMTISFQSNVFVQGSNQYNAISIADRVATGLVFYKNDYQNVSSGGTLVDPVLFSGAVVHVKSTGHVSGGVIAAGAFMYVSKGGLISGVTLNNDATVIVAEGSATDLTVLKGGSAVADFNGYITGTSDGSAFSIQATTVTQDFTVIAGYTQIVDNGKQAIRTRVLSGGSQDVLSGGTASGTILSSGARQWVSKGATVTGGEICGGYQYVSSGATATGVEIFSGCQYVSSGAIVSGTTLYGGNLYISSGASTRNTVLSGGVESLSYWASAFGTVILGGSQVLNSIAVAENTVVKDHGVQVVGDNYSYYNYGSTTFVTASNTHISQGGEQRILSYVLADGTVISSGGKLYVSNGSAANVHHLSGGILSVDLEASWYSEMEAMPESTYAYVSGTNEKGDFSVVSGTGTNLILYDHASLYVGYEMSAVSTTVSSGGILKVAEGGYVLSANVEAGGQVLCTGNATFESCHVASGGLIAVSGTHVSGVTLDEGAEVHLDFCGEITGTSNGQEFHSSCSTVVSGFEIESGYTQTVLAGYRAEKSHIHSGGVLYVSSGGTATDVLQDSGGILSAYFESVDTNTFIGGTNESGSFLISGGVVSNLMLYQSGFLGLGAGMVLSSATIQGGRVFTYAASAADIDLRQGDFYFGYWGGGLSFLRNFSIGSGGYAYLYSTVTIGGSLQVGGTLVFSGTILAESGTDIAVIVGRDQKGYLSNLKNLSSVADVSFSIQAESGLNGQYMIAYNLPADIPSFAFSVDGVQLGDLTLDHSVFYDGARYTLTRSGSTSLYLNVTANVSEESVQLISGENVVYCGPVAENMRIVIGETQQVRKGGRAVDTLVDFGGIQQIVSGGLASRTTVTSAGQLIVESGGLVSSATVQVGGSAVVSGGAVLSFLTLNGKAQAESSAEIGYVDIAEGGELHLAEGAILNGAITVSGRLSADGIVSANGARLRLRLNRDSALLNSTDYFGEATITLQVPVGETGVFLIAEQAPSESVSFTIDGLSGSLTQDSAVYSDNCRYTLSSANSGELSLEVKEVHVDYSVSGLLVPETFAVGETASFQWTLTNNGEMPSAGLRQSLYVVNASDPERKSLLKSVYLTDLPEYGESAVQTMDLTWSEKIGFTDSYFQVVVEADGDIRTNDNSAISASQYHFEQKLSVENLSGTVGENAGRIRAVAKRTGSPDAALTAAIVLNDSTGLVSVPQTVTFAPGESEKVFYLTVADNAEYQGDSVIQVGLQAQGYEEYSQSVTLTDDEMPALSIEVAAEELTEGDTFASFGKVKLDYALDHDLRVRIAYDKTQLSGIPDYVVIKAGETEAAFALTVIDDAAAEIDKTVKLTASADGVKSGTASLLVKDNDVPAIALTVNKTVVSESDGVYALVGTITRTDNSTNYVKVKFVDVNNSGLILPDTVTLGTGAQSVNFYIGIVDNALVDGDRTATVKANIYIDSCGCTVQPVSGETQVSFTILNDDGEALALSFDRPNVAENTVGAARLTITRNTVDGDALTVNLSVSGTSLLELPETVRFEAGQNSVAIDVNTLTDGVNTGNQMAVVTASAEGYASAAGYLNISDIDLPDFSISEVSLGEDQAYAGKAALVNLTLTNEGFQAYSGKVSVKLSLADGTDLGTYKVNGPFEVGETRQVGFYVNMPEIAGMKTLVAEVDPDNLISELNDGNNTAFSSSFEVKLNYVIAVETEPEVLYTKAPITVTGTTKRMDGTAIGNMPVEVLLKAATGEKLLKTTSDADGNYSLTVDTSDLYAGSYAVYAGNLGSFGAAQDRVEIAGMKINQPKTAFTWDVEDLTTTEGSFTITNLGGVALSGVTIRAVDAPDNFIFTTDGPAELNANGQLVVNYTITAAGTTEGGGYELSYGWQKINFVAESEEGVTAEFSGYFYSNPQEAVLTLSETKDVRTLYSGGEYYYEFQITNTGFGDSGEINLNVPENDLIKLISNPTIENLAYGESATVTLKISPKALGNDLALNAAYAGSIGISAENADAASFAFDYTFITNDKGNIIISLTDEWTYYAADKPMLSGAKVGVYNAYTNQLVTTGYSDENGIVTFTDLAEGKYILKYSADKHNNAQEVVTVRGGETLELDTFLQVSTVKYTWDVRKVELTDTYEIVLSTEFETNVPAPVVTIDGPTVLPELAYGESTLMNFTVTNHGLIAAQDFTFELPEIGNGYSWRVLNDQPVDIAPNSAITVTVLLERESAIKDNSYTINGITYYKTDKDGKPLAQNDDASEYYLSAYDADDNLISYEHRKDGITTTYYCQEDGSFSVTQDDPSEYYVIDGITYYKKDMSGNALDQSDTTPDSYTMGYDEDGNWVFYSVTRDGKTTSYNYSTDGKILSEVDADGTIDYTYDTDGNMATAVYSDGSVYCYDAAGKVTSYTDAAGNVTSYTYDAAGNISSVTSDGKTESYVYDTDGNLTGYTDVRGNIYGYSYNTEGQPTSYTVNGKTTSYTYDSNGNCTSITNAAGETSYYTYNDNGALTQFTDASGNVTTYTYNADNSSIAKTIYADGTFEEYKYDASNNVSNWIGRNGQTAMYTVNANGDVTSITYSDGRTLAYTYDADGNLLTANDLSFTYDANGNVLSQNYTDGRGIVYSYNADGSLASYTDELGHAVNYTYTVDGACDKLTDESGALIVDYDYTAEGYLAKAAKGNGAYTLYTYNEYGEVTAIDNYTAAGALESYTRYTYNSEGYRTAMITQDGAWAYTYDMKDQLVGAVFTDKAGQITQELSCEYDAAGNRTKAVENGVTITYTYNDLNQIISANGFNYLYDANGNLLEDEKRTYTWTADNRVASETLKSTGQTWEYGYDALGNRVSSKTNGVTTTWTVDENGNILAEYVDGVWNRTYYQGKLLTGFTDKDGNAYYYNADALGSVISVSGADGAAVNNYTYDPWGNEIASTEEVDNDFKYVGGCGLMANDSGTVFVRARNYDPETGRWISADPIGIDGGENLYQYVSNNPVCFIDKYGYMTMAFYVYGNVSCIFIVGSGLSGKIGGIIDLCGNIGIFLTIGASISAGGYIAASAGIALEATEEETIYHLRGKRKYYSAEASAKLGVEIGAEVDFTNATVSGSVGGIVISKGPDSMAIGAETGVGGGVKITHNWTYTWVWGDNTIRAFQSNGLKVAFYYLDRDTNIKSLRISSLKTNWLNRYEKVLPIADAGKTKVTPEFTAEDIKNGYATLSLDSSASSDRYGINCGIKAAKWFVYDDENQVWLSCSSTPAQAIDTTKKYGVAVQDKDGCWNETGTQIDNNGKTVSNIRLEAGKDSWYLSTVTVTVGYPKPIANAGENQAHLFMSPYEMNSHTFTINARLSKAFGKNNSIYSYNWSNGLNNSSTQEITVTRTEISEYRYSYQWKYGEQCIGEGKSLTVTLTVTDRIGQTSNTAAVVLSVGSIGERNDDTDCVKVIDVSYETVCDGEQVHTVPHYVTTDWCTDPNSSNLVGYTPVDTGSSGSVPSHSTTANSTGGGGFNSPSISTTNSTCKAYITPIPTAATPDGGMMSAAAVLTASAEDGEPDSICAHVKMEFKQTAVMSREGFEGTLTLTNEAATEMTDITFTATVLNSAGEDVSDLFEIVYNGADGFSITQDGDLTQYGLGNMGTGTFTVLYVPGRYTAMEGPEDYQFTGTISYTDSLVGDVSIDLTPITLTVNPSPSLQLHYFVERDVYADDPFTDAIEKSVPAEISVLVVNAGKGDARNFSLSGLTPEIVDNFKGLLLNYTMTDAAMNGVKNDNGIVDVNFGTVSANSSAVAQWWYKTNIQGHYSDYSVDFRQMDYSYVDLYGNVRYVAASGREDVSLIESADIHELIRSVQCGYDELPDFLVDDLADDADTPDTLYLSTGAVEDVNAVFAAVTDGSFGTNDVTITLTAEFEEGWNYLRILDPGNGDYELTGIVRDGEALNVRNFWQTDRYYLDELGVKYENRLHLLDHAEQAGTVEYTLTYTARDKNPLTVTSISGAEAVVKTAVGSVTVTFNKAVNEFSFTWEDIDLFRQGNLAENLITDSVTVTKLNDTTFEIGNLDALTAADGYYQLIVRTDGISDVVGNVGSDGKALNWTMASTVPAVASVVGIDDLMNSKADSVEIMFTASLDAATLTPAVFRVNGVSSDALVIAPVGESSTKFTVSGLSGLLAEGANVLEIDMTQVAGVNGNAGLQTARREWTIDMTAPVVTQLSESLGLVNASPDKLVFEASEEISADIEALTLKKDGAVVASGSMNVAVDGKKIIVTGINALSDGAYELELALDKIADAAGNPGSGTAVKAWTIDRTGPAQLSGFALAASCDLGESDSDGMTSTRDLTLIGILPEAGLRVRIYSQNGTKARTLLRELTPDGTSLETAVKVQGGHSVLIAELEDAAGNKSETSLSVFVDELAVGMEFQEKFKEELSASPETVTVKLSDAVDGLTADNFKLSIDGTDVPLTGASLVQLDELTYAITGINADANGEYTLTLDLNGVSKTSTGLAGSGTQSVKWTVKHAEAPTVVSSSIDSSQLLDGLATFSIVFSDSMNCPELIESGAISHAVRIVEVDGENNVVRYISLDSEDFQYVAETNTLIWNSAAPFDAAGTFRLVLDTQLLKSSEGVALAGGSTAEQHSYQTSEETVLTEPDETGTGTGAFAVPVWYDFNGDGKLDLLVGERTTETTGKIRVLLNVGTAESPAFDGSTYLQGASGDWTISAANCLGVAPRFADVDGDGTADLIYGTSDGLIEYAVNDGGVFRSGISLLADGTAIDVGDRAVFDLTDWNGDGCLDIVSGAMDGKIYLYVNNGDWTFAAARTLAIQVEDGWSAPAVADLDGDGDLDIVSGDGKGNLHRFLNSGDGLFTETDVSSGDSLRSRPFIADVNGDGLPDITVGYANGKVSVMYGEKGEIVAEDFRINASPVFSGTPAAEVEDYQVTITWEPASDDAGVSGYKVKLGDTVYMTTGTMLVITDLDVGTYSYQVGAYDASGLEGWSTLNTFEVKDVTPPELDGISSGKVWKNTVRLSWSPASDNVAVAGYRVELNGQTYDTDLTVYFFSGLELGEYEYRIGAVDTSGLIAWSGKQSFTVTEMADTLDRTLTETVPTADYGPGCVASSIGMLLGYYDKFGYCGFDVSGMVPGEIEPESRNVDGALLNTFIASSGYRSRFMGQSESSERPYTLTEQNELNTAAWDSLADWLGTGQKWRGNEDYATAYYYGTLDDVTQSQDTYSVSGTALPARFADFKYGLNLYVESAGYKLDGNLTRTVKADTAADGTFSFADYAAEIDAGRGVLISLVSPGNAGHMVFGYGYNEAGEIIFDDTASANRRMNWNGTYQYAGHEYTIQAVTTIVLDTANLAEVPKKLTGTPDKVSWESTGAELYVVEYSTDNFTHVIRVATTALAADMLDLPSGTYRWRVKTDDGGTWAFGGAIVSDNDSATPKVVRSNADGNDDLFFCTPDGTWENYYFAKHLGSVNDWAGTKEIISAAGKGRIHNLYFGSSDPNVLCLTDGDNGDALFVDDIYTDLPESVAKHTARLYQIQEIRAGAGDDIVDMTSQRYEYVGDGLTIRGGDGDDVIWASKGDNMLFGDDGNDRIVGASGNDVIAGGIGNDSMHGGGGDDIFTFCGNWGTDTVEQLETGTVTLWFADGNESKWNAETLTYTDGDNSVTVSGVSAEQITLKFGGVGDDAVQFAALSDMGAFDAFTSRKIFEEKGAGVLA